MMCFFNNQCHYTLSFWKTKLNQVVAIIWKWQFNTTGILKPCPSLPDAKGYLVCPDEAGGALTKCQYLTSWRWERVVLCNMWRELAKRNGRILKGNWRKVNLLRLGRTRSRPRLWELKWRVMDECKDSQHFFSKCIMEWKSFLRFSYSFFMSYPNPLL